jgi:hypothetical protein
MAPLICWGKARQLCANGYTAIYHENVRGNPLRASSVARWVLNRPGWLGGDEVFDQSEQVFCYSDVFAPYVRNRIVGKFYMPTIDEKLFYCDDWDLSKRSLECFYIGKSQWKEGIIDRSRVFEIIRDTPPKKELETLFRASRVLYCFDNSTILAYEAIICGCPVVIIPDGTQTREDYESLDFGMDGNTFLRHHLAAFNSIDGHTALIVVNAFLRHQLAAFHSIGGHTALIAVNAHAGRSPRSILAA